MISFVGLIDFENLETHMSHFEHGLARARMNPSGTQRSIIQAPAVFGMCARAPAPREWGPLQSPLLLVGDIRLDNRETLQPLLAPQQPRISDLELTAAAYLRWGPACVAHLLGEYAVALWDTERRQLFCFRDHLGHRPFFFSVRNNCLVFASQITALLAFPWVSQEPDPARMVEFLGSQSAGIDPQRTFFRDVARLPGGTTLTFSKAGLVLAPYWQPETLQETPFTPETMLQEFHQRFDNALLRCMGTHRRVGLCLSGGFDSACIALRSAELLAARGAELHAFVSVTAPQLDAVPVATREVCEALKRRLPNLVLHYLDGRDEPLIAAPELMALAEAPVPPLVQRLDLLFRRAENLGIEVMLTGYGGDHAVSPRGAGFLCDLLKRGHWRQLVGESLARSRRTGDPVWRILRHELVVPLLPRWLWHLALHLRDGAAPWQVNALCTEAYARQAGALDALSRNPSRGFRLQPGVRAAGCQGLTYIQSGRGFEEVANLARHRQLALARPLLDLQLVSFALTLPPHQHVHAGQRRALLRRAFGDALPSELRNRSERNDYIIPDLGSWAASQQQHLQAQLDALQHHPHALVVDLARLAALNASWCGEPNTDLRTAMLLLRGLSGARFDLWLRGDLV